MNSTKAEITTETTEKLKNNLKEILHLTFQSAKDGDLIHAKINTLAKDSINIIDYLKD